MGRLFIAAHRSLQYDFEISCEEIDFLVDTAIKIRGVYGARMTGAGFGGCTVNLVEPGAVDEFQARLSGAYKQRFQKTPLFYDCQPSASAGPISLVVASLSSPLSRLAIRGRCRVCCCVRNSPDVSCAEKGTSVSIRASASSSLRFDRYSSL